MSMKAKYKRLYVTLGLLTVMVVAVGIILSQLREHLVFFYSPAELQDQAVPEGQWIRVGGLVETGSVYSPYGGDSIAFVLTDLQDSIRVEYRGILPALFREGQGMVAGGVLRSDGVFVAEELLAKHDENYMPKEVADALKRSGKWRHATEGAVE